MGDLSKGDLKIGAWYRGKRPRPAGPFGATNDRRILYIGHGCVQYDGPAVKIGSRYPMVPVEKFLKWASHEIDPKQDEDLG